MQKRNFLDRNLFKTIYFIFSYMINLLMNAFEERININPDNHIPTRGRKGGHVSSLIMKLDKIKTVQIVF